MNKYIVITGSSSGIGFALCKLLLKVTDYNIVGMDRNPSRFNNNGSYEHFICDLTDFEGVDTLIQESGITKGKIKSLVNCAGIMPTTLITKMDPMEASNAFKLNCVAPLYLAKLFVKALSRSKDGSIINVTSITADLNIPGEVVYGATKASLKHASETMAIEFSRFGIRVNCVAPALVKTAMTEHLSESQKKFMMNKQVSKYSVTPDSVARTILFLIDAPEEVTSSTLYVGGIIK